LPGAIDVYPLAAASTAKVMVRRAASRRPGRSGRDAEVDRWLPRAELVPVGDGRWRRPSWRQDLTRENRLHRGDCAPARLRHHPRQAASGGSGGDRRDSTSVASDWRRPRGALGARVRRGAELQASSREGPAVVSPQTPLRLANPPTTEQGHAGTTLLAGLLRQRRVQSHARVRDLKLYELRARVPSGG